MRKIKIALIGLNDFSHAQDILKSLRKQTNIFELAGYTLPENEHVKFPHLMPLLEGCKKLTLEEIWNDQTIEAVAIETEEIYLTKYAILAAHHGKHIHMEKPGGTNLSDFEALINTAKNSRVVFHIGYMYRYNPYVIRLMEKIKNGDLGEIINVEAQMNYYSSTNPQWLEIFPGGVMFFLGCHLIDLILQIKGIPEKIIPLTRSTGLNGVTAEDFGLVAFEYPSGISFAKVSAVEVGGFSRRQLVVSGSKATIELKPLEMFAPGGQYTTMTEYNAPNNWADMGITTNSDIYDRYDSMLKSFAEMVCGEKENPYTYDYELLLYKIILNSCGV